MDLLEKLEAFIHLSEDDREIERAKNKDKLLARLYLLIIETELNATQKAYSHIKKSLLNQ